MTTTAAQRVCLSMIVKDEAPVIGRCLQALRPFIDCWCIVDTGSSDATPALIERQLAGLPGALHRRPWRNFAHNRNEALDLGRELLSSLAAGAGADRRDYLMVIDADETLELPVGYERPMLHAAAYELEMRFAEMSYARPSLVAAAAPWRYQGVLHEYLQCAGDPPIVKLPGPWITVRPEGARSRNPRKFHDDAALLEHALLSEPDNARYWFYLGQSYRDAGEPQLALQALRRRVALPGWEEETWYALFQIALLTERVAGDQDPDAVRAAYELAYQRRPSRAETLVELARWLRLKTRYAEALLCARAAAQIPLTADRLFVDRSAYGWRALDEWSIAAYYCECYAEGAQALVRLLAAGPPAEHMPRIRDNCGFFAAKGQSLW